MSDPTGLGEFRAGAAHVTQDEMGRWRLQIDPAPKGYSDAQIDDYHGLPRSRFLWRPPVRLSLRASVEPSGPLGTFGFGFWNDPFSLAIGQAGAGWRFPTLPKALWFFYGSPPNDFSFVPGQPGSGWRAMSLDSPLLPALVLAPGALAGLALLMIPGIRRIAYRSALGLVRASEASLTIDAGQWHEYDLEWRKDFASFRVDGAPVMEVKSPPGGPLGFVAWIDNQYAVLSPRVGLRFGVLATGTSQKLEIEQLRFHELAGV
jgi:hypothetical protein